MKRKMKYAIALFCLAMAAPLAIMANPISTGVYENEATEVTYQEVATDQIPEQIATTISEKFTDYSIDKFYAGSDETFKVEISKGDEKWAVFFDSEGKFSKKEDLSVDTTQETAISE